MKLLKHFLFPVFFLCFVLSSRAGDEKYQLTLVLSPSAEWLHFRNTSFNYNQLYGSKLSYNFGFEYKRFWDPSLSFSTGIQYQNKGFRNKTAWTIAGRNGTGITTGSAHFLVVPLYLNIHNRLSRKTELIWTAGLAGGYLLSQTVKNRDFPNNNDQQDDALIPLSNGVSNFNMFRDFHLGIHLGVGISAYVKSRIVMIIQPTYRYQLNDARNPYYTSSDYFTGKLNSLALDFKIGYFFTKQIRNRRKDL